MRVHFTFSFFILALVTANLAIAQLEPTTPVDVTEYDTVITAENAGDFSEIASISLFDDYFSVDQVAASASGRYIAIFGQSINIQTRDIYRQYMENTLGLAPVEEDPGLPKRVTVWDVLTGETTRIDVFESIGITVEEEESVNPLDVAISSDGMTVAAAYIDPSEANGVIITAWDVVTSDVIFSYRTSDEGTPRHLHLNEDGTLLTASMTRTISWWDLTTGNRLHQLVDFPTEASIFGSDIVDGTLYYANGRYIHVWDMATAELLNTYELPEFQPEFESDSDIDLIHHNTQLTSIAVSSDQSFAVTTSHRDGKIRVWDLTSDVWEGESEGWSEAITIYEYPELTYNQYIALNGTDDIAITNGGGVITAIDITSGEIVGQYYDDIRLSGAGRIDINETGSIIVAMPQRPFPALVTLLALVEE